jgi:hypothetical protein
MIKVLENSGGTSCKLAPAGGNGWSDGVYLVNLLSEKESLSTKFLKH